MLIEQSVSDFKAYKFPHGFVGSISDEKSATATLSPFVDNVVVKLHFKRGSSDDEQEFIWAYARVNAIASKSVAGETYDDISLPRSRRSKLG